jgi:hypothetical protein
MVKIALSQLRISIVGIDKPMEDVQTSPTTPLGVHHSLSKHPYGRIVPYIHRDLWYGDSG